MKKRKMWKKKIQNKIYENKNLNHKILQISKSYNEISKMIGKN